MEPGELARECRRVAATLDTTRNAWTIGVGRFVDMDEEASANPGDLNVVLEGARETGLFPSGPLAYSAGEVSFRSEPPYHSAKVEMSDGGEPFIRVALELGPNGLVVVAGTRSGRLAPDVLERSHVLLADLEAGILDHFTFLGVRAAQLGYTGPVRVRVENFSDIPGHPLRLRRLDEETGEPSPQLYDDPGAFEFTFDATDDPDRIQANAYAFCTEIAPAFGTDRPQLLERPKSDA